MDKKVVYECQGCGKRIYAGDRYWYYGRVLCGRCASKRYRHTAFVRGTSEVTQG